VAWPIDKAEKRAVFSKTSEMRLAGRRAGGELMRKSLALLTLVASMPGLVFAGDHVVTRQSVDSRLSEAAASRLADLATVGRTLDSPAARAAARQLGSDAGVLKASMASLSDRELRDLAVRAQALQSDPAAGLSSDVNTLLIVFLIVAIVIIVIKAVD
jgi:hypothetical protein